MIKRFSFGGGKGEVGNESVAVTQMQMRNRLRNEVVQIDRETRSAYNTLIIPPMPAVERVKRIAEEIGQLRDAIKMRRVPTAGEGRRGSKIVGPCPEKDRIRELKVERKSLKPIIDAAKKEEKEVKKPAIAALEVSRRADQGDCSPIRRWKLCPNREGRSKNPDARADGRDCVADSAEY